ncbi:hypothetical protein, partial [Gordonibacter sp.]
MKSYLTYTGEPRIIDGLLLAYGGSYLVGLVSALPACIEVSAEDEEGVRTIMYVSPRAFLDDWEAPF